MQSVAGRGDLRLLDRLVQLVGLVPADFRVLARVLTLAASQIFRATAGLTRENECVRNCETVGALVVLEHAHQHAQLDAVGMRLDLLGLRRQHVGHPGMVPRAAVGIGVMDRHVRIGDGRLFEVFVDAAPAALVAGFQLDGHPGAVVDLDPLDSVLLDRLAGRASLGGISTPSPRPLRISG